MSRGKQPFQALKEAKDIAKRYGMQMFERPVDDRGCDFAVIRATGISLVWVIRAKRFFISPYELEVERGECLRRIRKFPRAPEIAHEIWLRSQRGSWRFFRVYDSSIVEIRDVREAVPVPEIPAPALVPPAAAGPG